MWQCGLQRWRRVHRAAGRTSSAPRPEVRCARRVRGPRVDSDLTQQRVRLDARRTVSNARVLAPKASADLLAHGSPGLGILTSAQLPREQRVELGGVLPLEAFVGEHAADVLRAFLQTSHPPPRPRASAAPAWPSVHGAGRASTEPVAAKRMRSRRGRARASPPTAQPPGRQNALKRGGRQTDRQTVW